MKKSTFAAQLALMDHRGPWPDGAEEAREDYRLRLWAKAEPWSPEMTRAFCGSIETAVSRKGQYGRPTVDELVNAAFDRAKSRGGQPAEPAGPYPGGFFVAPEERKKAAETLRAWLLKTRARMAASPMFGARAPEFAKVERDMGPEETRADRRQEQAPVLSPQEEHRARVRDAMEDWRERLGERD